MVVHFLHQGLIFRDRALQKSRFCSLRAVVVVKSCQSPPPSYHGRYCGLLSLLWSKGNKCASFFTRNTWKYVETAIGEKRHKFYCQVALGSHPTFLFFICVTLRVLSHNSQPQCSHLWRGIAILSSEGMVRIKSGDVWRVWHHALT